MPSEFARPRRRSMLIGAGLGAIGVVVTACSTYGKKPAAESSTQMAQSPATSGASSSAAAPQPLTKTADVPVGSGVILGDTVVTQPTAGDFKGFSSVCTHAGCKVNEVVDGTIVCPCHGSRFNLDGSVAKGPAKEPLAAKPVSVQGDAIFEG